MSRWWRYTRCVCGKRGYATKGVAEAALHTTEATQPPEYNDPRPLAVYYCATGKCWHVGHRSRNQRRVETQPGMSA